MQVTPEMIRAAREAMPTVVMGDAEISAVISAALDAAGSIDLPVTANIRVQIDEQAFHASAAEAVQHLHDTLPRDQSGRITLATFGGAQVQESVRALVDETAIAAHFQVPPETVGTWVTYSDGFVPPFPAPASYHGQHGDPLWDMREIEDWHKAWLNGKEPYRTPAEVNLGGDMIPRLDGVTRVRRTRPRGNAGGQEVPGNGDPRGPLPPMVIPDDHPVLDTNGFEDPMATALRHLVPVIQPRPLAAADQLHHHLGVSREVVARMIVYGDYKPPFPQPVCEYGEDREPLYDPEAVKAWYDALPQAADG